jgi:hypothetical protein
VSDARRAQVRRILDRYLVEVVERYELCPWARAARVAGELAVEIELGAQVDWIAAATRALARPDVRVAMVVAPDLPSTRTELAAIRDAVAAQLPAAGVADFHPAAPLDVATPARAVPFLRRAPDPMLQLVPLALLDAVRASTAPDRAAQARALGGHATPAPRDVATSIARANHATLRSHHAEIAAILDDIAADRKRAY